MINKTKNRIWFCLNCKKHKIADREQQLDCSCSNPNFVIANKGCEYKFSLFQKKTETKYDVNNFIRRIDGNNNC